MRKIFLTAIVTAFLSSCAVTTTTMNVLQDETKFDPVKVESIASYITDRSHVQRANNLFVLFDASASSTGDYPGVGFKANNDPSKLEAQREILHRMNQTIYNSASVLKLSDFKTSIRSFGYGDCNGYGDRYTDLHQKPEIYSKDAVDKAIDTIQCSHGRSYMGRVLVRDDNNVNPVSEVLANDPDKPSKSVDEDLNETKGNISLVIISDLSKSGVAKFASTLLPEYLNPNLGEDDKEAIKALRQKYGNRLCVYNVWMNSVNKSPEDPKIAESEDFSDLELMYSAENPADCGGPAAFTADRVAETDGMKDFMRAVLLTKVPPPPAPDCSQLDSDGDGVNDCDDKCPNTLKGTPVNKLGCWIVDVKFDNDRSIIKPQYFALLDKLAVDISTNFAGLKIEVQGHTSSTASAEYNMRLSIRRANAVATYLNKKIRGPHRLIPRGYGLTRPIDTNETAAGRANNRRVQLEILP
jgi:OOP family OmpA-OmpF porin